MEGTQRTLGNVGVIAQKRTVRSSAMPLRASKMPLTHLVECICRATWVQILSKVHLLHVIPLLSHSVSIYCQKTYHNMPKISLKKHSCNITGMFKETVKRATVLNCCLKS